jgi:hypothetical protein
MLSDGELSITPEYQRKYRWPTPVASAFIESVFLGLPVPPIFVATNAGFQWEVVDGLQRLSSLMYFLSSTPEDLAVVNRTQPMALEDLQKLTQLNGLGYQQLTPALQRYFGRQPLQVISLTDKSSKEVRFDLFERLNAGAIALSPQEVRACIYRGEFNQFIEGLAEYDPFVHLLKLQESKQHDGTNTEEVLKFFAYKNSRADFDGRVKKFLNDFTASAQTGFDYDTEGDLFRRAADHLWEACGRKAMTRTATHVTPLVQFEACMVAIGELLQEGTTLVLPAAGWQDDAELTTGSTGGSNTRAKLKLRVDRAKALFSGAS